MWHKPTRREFRAGTGVVAVSAAGALIALAEGTRHVPWLWFVIAWTFLGLGILGFAATFIGRRKPPAGFEDQLRYLITGEAKSIRQLHDMTGYAISLVEAATDSMVTAGTAIPSINERGEVVFHAVDVSIAAPIEATFDVRKQAAPKDAPPGQSDQSAP